MLGKYRKKRRHWNLGSNSMSADFMQLDGVEFNFFVCKILGKKKEWNFWLDYWLLGSECNWISLLSFWVPINVLIFYICAVSLLRKCRKLKTFKSWFRYSLFWPFAKLSGIVGASIFQFMVCNWNKNKVSFRLLISINAIWLLRKIYEIKGH